MIFSFPFLSVSPFLLLNLVQRQRYAYAIGLYTRPEIKRLKNLRSVVLNVNLKIVKLTLLL